MRRHYLTKSVMNNQIGSFCFVVFLILISKANTPPVTNGTISSENLFSLRILGTTSDWVLVPMVVHPNTTDIPPDDVAGYMSLALSLQYSGENLCKITKIVVWQAMNDYEGYWNRTKRLIAPPTQSITSGSTYAFLFEVYQIEDAFILGGIIVVQLTTREYGEIEITSRMPAKLIKIHTWPLVDSSSTHPIGLNVVNSVTLILFSFGGLFLLKKLTNKKSLNRWGKISQ